MSERGMAESRVDDDLKKKLVLRVFFAGMMIVLLLGALAFIDSLGTPPEEPATSGPVYSAPVPVPKKDVSQPVKPAEPLPAPTPAVEPAREPVTVPPPPPPVPEPPAPPAVPPQPSLPRSETRPAASAPIATPAASRPAHRVTAPVTPAEGTSAATTSIPAAPPQEHVPSVVSTPAPVTAPASAPAAAPERGAPSPPRLLSGFVVQAGVFADAQRAEELRAKLTLNGIPSSLEARVQVGPFRTREEAIAAQDKLKALGIEGVLLPPRGARR